MLKIGEVGVFFFFYMKLRKGKTINDILSLH